MSKCKRCGTYVEIVWYNDGYGVNHYCKKCLDEVKNDYNARETARRQLEAQEEAAEEARKQRIAQEKATEEILKNANLSHYTCCHCDGNFRADHGYSAISSPIHKPVCNSCFELLKTCNLCGTFLWSDAKETHRLNYIYRKEEGSQSSEITRDEGEVFLCPECSETRSWAIEQKSLKTEYELRHHCCHCGKDFEDGFTPSQSPIRKPLCSNCFQNNLDVCRCCGEHLWKDDCNVLSLDFYLETIDDEIVKTATDDTEFVCSKCRPSWEEAQKALAEEFKKFSLNKDSVVVAADGSGDFEKISDALNQTNCSEILVKSGDYQEHLVINRKVTIKGDVSETDLIYGLKSIPTIWDDTTKNNAIISIEAEGVVLKDIEVKGNQKEFDKNYAYTKCPDGIDVCDWWPKCIYVKKNCTLDGLTISNSAGHGVVCNETDFTIQNCTIKCNSRMGAMVRHKASGKFSNSEIYGNHLSGLSLCEGPTSIIEKCKIHNNNAIGIIAEDSSITIIQSKIFGNQNNGIYFNNNSLAQVDNCDIYENLVGIMISQNSNPTIKGCKIHENRTLGVLIQDKGLGSMEECEIYKNTASGIEISQESNPTIRGCKVYECEAGFHICKKSLGEFENCEIYGNRASAIDCTEESNPTIKKCKIHNGIHPFYGHKKSKGSLVDCDIHHNSKPIYVAEGSSPTITGCLIHNGESEGIIFVSDANGVVENCDINNHTNGITIKKGSNPTIKECKIHDGHRGILVEDSGTGTIECCEIFKNNLSIEDEASGAIVKGCKMYDNSLDPTGKKVASFFKGLFKK